MKYALNDIFIVQAPVSNIDSRSECYPFHTDGTLPLFTAPMSSVVDLKNYKLFIDNKINPIIPRSVDFLERRCLCGDVWCAFSLDEFISFVDPNKLYLPDGKKLYVLIDTANGNMKKLHDVIRLAKDSFGDGMQIMAGNIANPEAYAILSDAGADYIRCGIGGGSACITASNTGIYYTMGSLIKECFEKSLTLKNPASIIADGGIKGFGDIMKCLALGADFVMCGSAFNKMLESAGETYELFYNDDNELEMGENVNQYGTTVLESFNEGYKYCKSFYGMSTKKAQKELGNSKLKTSEGIEKVQNVEYTMSKWTENFTDYLKSAMSYTGSIELYDFIGNVETIIVSNSSYDSVNK